MSDPVIPKRELEKIHSALVGIGLALAILTAAVVIFVLIYAIHHPYK